MKNTTHKKIISVILLIISILMSWGGLLYAASDLHNVHIFALLITLLGCCLAPWAICLYDSVSEKKIT